MKKFTFLLSVMVVVTLIGFGQTAPLTPVEELGKEIFFDKISSPGWMSCATCHGANVGFTGPIPGINKHGAVYRGAVPQRFGNRKPPSVAYATFSPVFHFDTGDSLFIGGNFWDGRATGEHLGNPAADQALGPFLNPVEQNNASRADVLEQIANSKYGWMWNVVWGDSLDYITPANIETNYDRVGLSIQAYEESHEVNAFTSKYDYYLQGLVDLSSEEMEGLNLFNGKALCNACHPSELGPGGTPPLFTDFSFDNLGVPKNSANPFYDMDMVYLDDGNPINPAGHEWIDLGLGKFLQSRTEWASMAGENMGKHKVPTLRNVDKRPGNSFTKAYMHNGVFKSLKEVVNFYNTRDVSPWAPPEVAQNVNTDELGDLMLTDSEENAIVAFLKTLSDGYKLNANRELSELWTIERLDLALNTFDLNNGSIRISYTIPEDDYTKIDVLSSTGELIGNVIDQQINAGEYSTAYLSSNLSTGVYLVRMQTGEKMIVKKVFITKR